MTKTKKGSEKRKTKAGMLGENYDSSSSVEKEEKPENRPETTPKISKERAEGGHGDKPLH